MNHTKQNRVDSKFQKHCSIMAKEPSLCLLFLSLLIFCCWGTSVGFSYLETGDTALSTSAGATFLQKSKISQSQIRFVVTDHEILSALSKSIHSVPSKLQLSREVKVSVAFPLSFLENLNPSYEKDLLRILWFIKETNSFIMIEDNINGESSLGDHFVQSVIKRATLAASILPCKDVPLVLTIKSPVIPSSMELAQFSETLSKYLEAESHITKRIAAFYLEIYTTEGFVQKELKRTENLSMAHIRTLEEANNSPPTTGFPTNPATVTPAITPPDTPTIITVPSTNPVTSSPTNPAAATPVTVPSTTPVPPSPPTNPANSPVPITNPVTAPPTTVPGAQPVANPVNSSYPPPSGSVPVTNPLPPPQSTNAPPATQGQSWCVAKSGVPETTLQSALDYACGMGTADCSQIQQSGSCYNPNSIQNHASVAFNSYYQKNPGPTSCDFGGAATIVSTNPSSGTCVYPSSSSGAGTSSGTATPPSAFGSQSPPDANISHSTGLRPFLGCMVLVISLVCGRLGISP